jgi:hypothetical protein
MKRVGSLPRGPSFCCERLSLNGAHNRSRGNDCITETTTEHNKLVVFTGNALYVSNHKIRDHIDALSLAYRNGQTSNISGLRAEQTSSVN